MPNITINQVEYSSSDKGPVIYIFGRDEKGVARRIEVTGFRPYFYAPRFTIERIPLPKVANIDLSTRYTGIKGEDLCRIYTNSPSDVRDVREKFKHFEADIIFTTRFLIDTGLKGGVSSPSYLCDYHDLRESDVDYPARVCIMDIECDDSNGWPDSSRDPITCITCHDSFTDIFTTFLFYPDVTMKVNLENNHILQVYSNETAMLHGMVAYIKSVDPDILTGWNFTGFDMPYILGRMSALRISPESMGRISGRTDRVAIRGRQLFDLLSGYKRMHLTEKESYRLDAIAKDELGEQKLRYSGKISDMWRDDPLQLVRYNAKDVDLCVKINRKDETIDFHRELSRYVGCPLDKTLNSSTLIDIYILRKAHGRYVLPSKGNAPKEDYEGAIVFEPGVGIKENVVVLDLRSLYPMITMTINASPETKSETGELRAPNGVRFKKEPDGLARSILGELLKERDDRKALRNTFDFGSRDYKLCDMQQNVIKVLMNSYYGVSGYTGFRLHDRDIAAAVTSVGRAILEHNRTIIESYGFKICLGDTDSGAFPIPVERGRIGTIETARAMERILNASYSDFAKKVLNADMHFFSIKFEKIYERFFQGGKKKRYAGLLVWKEGKEVNEIDVVGFEIKRSDSSTITKLAQKTLVEMVLKGETYDMIRKQISDIVRNYRSGKYSLDEIGIPGGINKSLQDYENKDAQIRGAIYANEHLGANFGKGSKPKRIYINGVPKGYPRTDVVCFEYGDQIPDGFRVDIDTMLEKTIRAPLERIMEALGWNWNEFDPSITTLSQWGI